MVTARIPAGTTADGLDLAEVARRAQALLDVLGRRHLGASLSALGWHFGYDRARRRIGACHWRRGGTHVRRITLSVHFARVKAWPTLEETLRHEIAHALDYETRGKSDHGPAWKTWARRCGASPSRLYHGASLGPEAAPYVGVCPRCAATYPFYRRLKRARACAACCDRHAGGGFDERFVLALRRND